MISEKSLKLLGSCCLLLEELDLTDCCGINEKGLKVFEICILEVSIMPKHIRQRANLYFFELLHTFSYISIGDGTLVALSRGCKKLKKLNLSYCNEITDKGMEFHGHLE